MIKMNYRQLGESDVFLSVLTFGAWAIGSYERGVENPENAIAAIKKAYELGFTSYDTGPLYGFGYSEEVLAKATQGMPRDKIQIITKCGVVWEGSAGKLWYPDKRVNGRLTNIYKYSGRDSIMKECENSLKRLKTDYLDLFSIHWPDPTTPIEESMEAFERLKQSGKIRAAGLSNEYRPEEYCSAGEVTSVASGKVRYSMLNRGIERELIPFCQQTGTSLLAYSVLQRGILTGLNLPKFLWTVDDNPWEVALYEPENMKRIRHFLDQIEPIVADYGFDLTHLGINWVINRPGITAGLLAATDPSQIAYDIRALDLRVSDNDMILINNHLRNLEKELDYQSGVLG